VSDPIVLARTARESLSKGLSALQGDPSVPAAVAELAGSIAQAMGALHQIERTQGATLQPHADNALTHIRTALGKLQTQPATHAAVTQAMEAVAASLASAHALSKMAAGPAGGPVGGPQAAQQPPRPAAQAAPVQAAPMQAAPNQAPPRQAAPVPVQAAPNQAPPRQAAPVPAQPSFPQPGQAGAMTAAMQAPARPGPAAQPAPAPAPAPAPSPAAARQADPFAAPRPAGAAPAGAPVAGGAAQLIDAALGAHSVTNFYKGLAGNDIIEHGGLFVGTYMIPKLGTQVRLRVSLPGGYEFEAAAVVRWRRDPGDGDSQPGFGAQLTQISAEAKQLIYRYVRNREPLFHDDL
jgi:hypothetical protein